MPKITQTRKWAAKSKPAAPLVSIWGCESKIAAVRQTSAPGNKDLSSSAGPGGWEHPPWHPEGCTFWQGPRSLASKLPQGWAFPAALPGYHMVTRLFGCKLIYIEIMFNVTCFLYKVSCFIFPTNVEKPFTVGDWFRPTGDCVISCVQRVFRLFIRSESSATHRWLLISLPKYSSTSPLPHLGPDDSHVSCLPICASNVAAAYVLSRFS